MINKTTLKYIVTVLVCYTTLAACVGLAISIAARVPVMFHLWSRNYPEPFLSDPAVSGTS